MLSVVLQYRERAGYLHVRCWMVDEGNLTWKDLRPGKGEVSSEGKENEIRVRIL